MSGLETSDVLEALAAPAALAPLAAGSAVLVLAATLAAVALSAAHAAPLLATAAAAAAAALAARSFALAARLAATMAPIPSISGSAATMPRGGLGFLLLSLPLAEPLAEPFAWPLPLAEPFAETCLTFVGDLLPLLLVGEPPPGFRLRAERMRPRLRGESCSARTSSSCCICALCFCIVHSSGTPGPILASLHMARSSSFSLSAREFWSTTPQSTSIFLSWCTSHSSSHAAPPLSGAGMGQRKRDWVGPNLWSAPPAPDGQTEVLGESKMSDRFKHCFGSCGVACKTDAPFDSPLCTDLPLSPCASNYCIALKSTLHLHGADGQRLLIPSSSYAHDGC